jgi:hypothetical protein
MFFITIKRQYKLQILGIFGHCEMEYQRNFLKCEAIVEYGKKY